MADLAIVAAMTTMTMTRRMSGAAVAAAFAVAAVFGPGPTLITRLGAGDQVAFATVSAADTITSNDILADVPAAGRAS